MRTLTALILFATSSVAQAGAITVKGSDTLVILAQRWAEEFGKRNPDIKLQVTGGGSGTGLAALVNGTTQIATSSRPMKDSEKEKLRDRFNTPGVEIAVAKDGVTFYVNEGNPVGALTQEQVRDIYLGDITNWKQVGGQDAPVIVYARENSSGTYVFVKDNLLMGQDFLATAQTLPGTAAVVNAVAKEKNGIGFGGAAYAKGIKSLKIKVGGTEVSPDAASVKSGQYPLARDLYFYLKQKPTGELKAFIDFVLSPAGQEIVVKVGYFPVK